jgi:hypothetical protein
LPSRAPAAFDYNFEDSEIKIDECRNSSEYAVRASIALVINKAPTETLVDFFQKASETETFEGGLDEYYLSYERGKNWQAAWEQFAGDAFAINQENAMTEYARRKGYRPKALKSDTLVKVAGKMGIKTVSTVLGQHAGSGKIPADITTEAKNSVETVWSWCEVAGMTNGKPKPKVSCFKQLMDAEGECLGYYDGTDTVYLRDDLGGKLALKTAIEEVAHYITGATDNSRDFQNFAFDMIVELSI